MRAPRAFALLALAAACGAREEPPPSALAVEPDAGAPPVGEELPAEPSPPADAGVDLTVDGASPAPDACYAELDALGVKATRVEARGVVAALRLDGPVNGVVFANGTSEAVTRDPVACAFVRTLWDFAALLRERGFVRVGTLGSYCYRCCCAWSSTNICRGLEDPEPTCADGYSNHSWGRAVDVRYLVRADGRTLDVRSPTDWVAGAPSATCAAGLAAQKGASRELYELACEASARRLFGTILTPNYGASHRDHLHMDIGRAGVPVSMVVRSLAEASVDRAAGGRCDE